MLVLSRKNGQKIIINDNIEITILEASFNNCKIAINAPKDVKIFREEVYQQIQQSNRLSDNASMAALDSLDLLMGASDSGFDAKKNHKIIIKKKEK